ncbi:MAG: Do family serine endopeptidase [Nitrospira sp.]|uniref:Periplasmic serine endoprotease DegP-like n=1 Tax=Nitrospira defluvii TaxID=330214 RepID=A0ABM8RST5_9BACT|nr:Do family serine endopeptidase [Nitrospira defluvii]MCS6326499.1 Do family serine endopeptidase [Nitrospira sp.]CAE6769868.1 putative periplasmic serine endoprotease DegP-like [Nitrospira defluvii]
MKTPTSFSTLTLLGLGLAGWLFGMPIPTVPAADSGSASRKTSPGLRMLEELQTVITDLAEEAKPSVVSIFPVQAAGRSREAGERVPNSTGSGSGVIVDAVGHIITNNHVVGDATEVEVRLSDKTKLFAQVIGKDPDTDLAVLKVTTDHPLPAARFGDSSGVKVGQWVLAVGNPFGLDRTVTLGVVSGIGRENINLSRYENFIQTDASINPGNSGGPLFDLRGDIIGINTAIINFAQGIGFAIPSNMAKQVMNQLINKGKVVRAWLGVGLQPLTLDLASKFGVDENEGVLVNEVFERDPAALAGIRPGDVITKVDGALVDTPNKLSRLVAALDPGSMAIVEVVRDGKRMNLNVALSERRDAVVTASLPQSRSDFKLGIDVQDLTAGLAEKFRLNESRGVLISKVESGSLAQAEGLREGDLIKEVNRADTGTVGEFTIAVAKVKRGDTILLRVLREGRAFYVVLKPSDH